MTSALTETDRRVLDRLQQAIPLTPQPYKAIADACGLTEAQVLERVAALSGPPPAPIRQISAIFDSRSLGYQSCLVAARVDPAQLARAADIISGHPGVSHNYQREHAYNLWFTLAVPPESRLGLEGTAAVLQRLSGADQLRLMPSLKLYKIGVKFDLGGEGEASAPPSSESLSRAPNVACPEEKSFAIGEADRRMIRVLQQHLPIESHPFDGWAHEAGVSVEQLLASARRYLELGVMRRFSAVLRHRSIGVSANAMGVWNVPPDQHDDFGAIAAQNPAVSHCYLRPTYADWTYSLFTMVHGKTRVDCEATLAAISLATGVRDYTSLYSVHEYKKVRVRYFTDEIEQWEAEHAAAASLEPAFAGESSA